VLTCPGRTVFVKAVGAELNSESPDLHRREAAISAALPAAPQLPTLLDIYDDGDWVALAFEAVDGRPPVCPWEARELQAAVRALERLHRLLTPSPAAIAPPATLRLTALLGGWSELAAQSTTPAGLDEWAARHLAPLAELEADWPEAVVGETLLHCDVRADNMLVTDRGVVFVDWPHACVGTAVFDVVAWAPSVELEGGPPPEELLAMYPGARAADPDAVTVLVAALSGFFIAHSLRPPSQGLPTLRAFQAAQGGVALTWLRRRTGW
jgi:Ser/Thr protein kinase RdoA (MazF antagonist)